MRDNKFPAHASLKQSARRVMMHRLRPCMYISAILLACQMAALYLQLSTGAVLSYYLFNSSDYTDATGIRIVEGGITAILRMDAAGALFALPLSFRQLAAFVLVRGMLFILIVPLLMGSLEHFHAILHDQARPLRTVFRWYLDLRLTFRAVGLGFILETVRWSSGLLCALPGLALLVWASGSAGLGAAASWVIFLAMFLILAGTAAGYWVYTLVLPAQYLLARDPHASVGNVLSAAVKSFRGYRWNYYMFRLSFLLWNVLVNVSNGAAALIVLPYAALANLSYLQTVMEPNWTEDTPEQL